MTQPLGTHKYYHTNHAFRRPLTPTGYSRYTGAKRIQLLLLIHTLSNSLVVVLGELQSTLCLTHKSSKNCLVSERDAKQMKNVIYKVFESEIILRGHITCQCQRFTIVALGYSRKNPPPPPPPDGWQGFLTPPPTRISWITVTPPPTWISKAKDPPSRPDFHYFL